MAVAKRRPPGREDTGVATAGNIRRPHVASSRSGAPSRSRSVNCCEVIATAVLVVLLCSTGWLLLGLNSLFQSDFTTDNTPDPSSEGSNRTWEELFSILRSFDPSSTPPSPLRRDEDTGRFDILYYHVRKAGGSSIYEMFDRLNRKYGNPPNPGKVGCYGQELPGHFNSFLSWRDRYSNNNGLGGSSFSFKPSGGQRRRTKRLLVMSFREPIERTISHYFQAKPCPDGRGGGADNKCRKAAEEGIDVFLSTCKFARSWQYQYLGTKIANIEKVDFVLPVDHVDEAIILLSAKYNIPIQHLFYTHNKVPLKDANLQDNGEERDNKGEKKIFTCAAEWIKKLVPADKLRQYNESNCGKACAGKIGMLAFTDRQLKRMQIKNADDILLWREVSRRYDEERHKLLVKYEITEEELQSTISQYQKARQQYEEYLGEVEGKFQDDCAVKLMARAKNRIQARPSEISSVS